MHKDHKGLKVHQQVHKGLQDQVVHKVLKVHKEQIPELKEH